MGLTSLNSQGYVSVLFTPDNGGAIDPSTITAGMISVSGPVRGHRRVHRRAASSAGRRHLRVPLHRPVRPGRGHRQLRGEQLQVDHRQRRPEVGNLAQSQNFTVVQLTAGLSRPEQGATVSTNTINYNGYFDVTYIVPSYATSIDPNSLAVLGPQATATGPSGGSFAVDNTQQPVLVRPASENAAGQTYYTYRYWYIGTDRSGNVNIHFNGGSLNYLDASGGTIPLFAPETETVANDGTNNYVDVSFGTSTTLNPSSVTASSITVAGATATTPCRPRRRAPINSTSPASAPGSR